jgi:serine protease Do
VERLHLTTALLLGLAAAGLAGCEDRAAALTRPEDGQVGAPPPPAAPPPPEACVPTTQAAGALDVAGLVERVGPVVVSVRGSRTVDFDELHDRLDLPHAHRHGPTRVERAVGSGVIIAAEGLVLTNHHVVDGAFDVEVRLADDRAFEASVIGRDPKLDVAVLKLRGADRLPVATLGLSEEVRVGDRAIVIGNPFGLGPTVTLGIVSATSREVGAGPFDGFIQTDAAINPGNSGGPLFNEAGQVIGITAAIHAQGQGIGFAIPIDDVRDVLPELRETGGVTRGRMGLAFQEVTAEIARALRLPSAAGALVTDVEPGGPAARAGIRPGDLIVRMDARSIGHARDLARALGRHKPDDVVALLVRRDGAQRALRVKLDRAEEEASPRAGPARARPAPRGALGLSASDAPGGARIEAIPPQSALAEELEVGDVVLELNGAAIGGAADLVARLRAATPGADLLLRVRREGASLYLVIQTPS